MSAGSLCWSPSPSSLLEANLRPENIRREVLSNPRSQLPEVQSASVVFFQVLDESSAVLNESSVASHPDLQDAAFAYSVAGPQHEAHAIVVAKKRKEAVVVGRIVVRSVRKETNAMAVDVDSLVGEKQEFSVVGVAPGLDNFQGVGCRLVSSDRFLGHLVAAIFGDDAVGC